MTSCDVDELLAMHGRCSVDSRFGRWHGHTKRFPPSYLARLLGEDLAIVARSGDRDDRVIGLGSAAHVAARAGSAESVWEVGLLVEDEWQRLGVGGQLLTELMVLARESGASVIRAQVLARDAVLLAPLKTLGPTIATMSHGIITADVRPWG